MPSGVYVRTPEYRAKLRAASARRWSDPEQHAAASSAHLTHGGTGTRLYGIWVGMHQRVANPKSCVWQWYGGKGIAVCDEWRDFAAFRNWALANGYTPDLTIDRLDAAGDYEPRNCQWIGRAANTSRARRASMEA